MSSSIPAPSEAAISIAESIDLRARIKTFQKDWTKVVAEAVEAARLAKELAPRVNDLERQIKALDEIATRLTALEAKVSAQESHALGIPRFKL